MQVGEFLERKGYKWLRTAGSKGAVDVIAKKRRKKWAIQVKATRKDYTSYTRLTKKEEQELITMAILLECKPILALTAKNYVWFVTVPEEKLLLKGKLKPLKYKYPSET